MNALSPTKPPFEFSQGPAALRAQGVSVVYPRPGERPISAVRDLSLTIHKGEFVALMGEPGSGKSTAAMALMGLVRPPGIITSGSIMFSDAFAAARSA